MLLWFDYEGHEFPKIKINTSIGIIMQKVIRSDWGKNVMYSPPEFISFVWKAKIQ